MWLIICRAAQMEALPLFFFREFKWMWYVHTGLYFKQALSHGAQQPVRNLQLIRSLWQIYWFSLRHQHAPSNTWVEQALCAMEHHSQCSFKCSGDTVCVFHQRPQSAVRAVFLLPFGQSSLRATSLAPSIL